MPPARKKSRTTIPTTTKKVTKKTKPGGATRSRTQTKGHRLDDDSDVPPTDEEWAKLKKSSRFYIMDEDQEQHRFQQGDFLAVWCGAEPDGAADQDRPLWQLWIGKMIEMAQRASPDDTWIKIEWFYSGQDVKQECKSLYERILSSHCDYVTAHSVSGLANIKPYDERSLNPRTFDDETFYYRRTYDHLKRRITHDIEATCICRSPYNPDDNMLMHFCPRKGCRRWYHAICLRNNLYMDDDPEPGWDISLLRSNPDSREPFVVPPSDSEGTPGIVITKRTTTQILSKDKGKRKAPDTPTRPTLNDLPAALVTLAKQQIVKGKNPYGLAGNVKEVVKARRLVYQYLQAESEEEMVDTQEEATKWIIEAKLDGRNSVRTKGGKSKAGLPDLRVKYSCPSCQGAI